MADHAHFITELTNEKEKLTCEIAHKDKNVTTLEQVAREQELKLEAEMSNQLKLKADISNLKQQLSARGSGSDNARQLREHNKEQSHIIMGLKGRQKELEERIQELEETLKV